MSKLGQISDYIAYYSKAANDHGIHSPFVFEIYNEVFKDNRFYFFDELDEIRKSLEKNTTEINITDLGAGSKTNLGNKRSISQIAKSGIARKKYAHALYKLVQYLKPANVIELGTSLGLTTLHFSKANKDIPIHTIEGCPELYKFSKKLFEAQNANNIHGRLGNFDTEFPALLDSLTEVGLLYIDGNHTYEATLRYFNQALTKTNEKSVMVFDDIYWSPEMKDAWLKIKEHPSVTLTLDFFYLGVVFFRTEQKEKQHFVLRF